MNAQNGVRTLGARASQRKTPSAEHSNLVTPARHSDQKKVVRSAAENRVEMGSSPSHAQQHVADDRTGANADENITGKLAGMRRQDAIDAVSSPGGYYKAPRFSLNNA